MLKYILQFNLMTLPFNITNEGTTTLYYYSTDNAGNFEPTKNQAIKIDKTPPVITGNATTSPNGNGWYNTNVTIHFTASDNVSGIDTVTPDITLSAEGSNQSVSGTATDKAGNNASFTVTGINIDKTPSQIAINIPTNGSAYTLNQTVFANWSASDSISGIASATGTTPSGAAIDTASIGTKTFSVNAEDNAGNTMTKTATYYIYYNYSGILQPINADGSSIFKLGSTVPVKFQLQDANGKFITNAIAKIYVAKISDGMIGTEMEANSTSNATTGNLFRYDNTSNQYIFNLGTKTLSTGTWQIRIELDDGTSKYVTISLR